MGWKLVARRSVPTGQTRPMPITFRTAEESDWEAICRVDGRNFGFGYTPERDRKAPAPSTTSAGSNWPSTARRSSPSSGVFTLQVTVPGAGHLPMGGLTWVSTSATHRRQGLLTQLMARSLADVDRRGEPVAMLGASEGGDLRAIRIRSRDAAAGDLDRSPAGAGAARVPTEARRACGSSMATRRWSHVAEVWSRFHRNRVGRGRPQRGVASVPLRRSERPNAAGSVRRSTLPIATDTRSIESGCNGTTASRPTTCDVIELVANTPDAHAALWHTLLGVDLVGPITSRQVPIDDPLPYLLTNPRALETTALNDGVWVNVRDVKACFGGADVRHNRSHRHRGRRRALGHRRRAGRCDVQPGQESARPVARSRLVGRHSARRRPCLDAGRRPPAEARNDEALRRADAFFVTSPAPHCQTMY